MCREWAGAMKDLPAVCIAKRQTGMSDDGYHWLCNTRVPLQRIEFSQDSWGFPCIRSQQLLLDNMLVPASIRTLKVHIPQDWLLCPPSSSAAQLAWHFATGALHLQH